MSKTFLDFVLNLGLPRWSGPNGSTFMGIVLGVTSDQLLDGATTALFAPWCTMPQFQPLDAIDALGNDCGRPHYPGETYDHARTRILGKWDFWTGSPKQGIIDELSAAGYPGAVIRVPAVPDPIGYWSRIFVRMPFGTHPVTGPNGFVTGTSVTGAGVIGPAGLTAVYYNLMKSICDRYKPFQYVVWDFEFEYTPGTFVRLMSRLRFADALYVYNGP